MTDQQTKGDTAQSDKGPREDGATLSTSRVDQPSLQGHQINFSITLPESLVLYAPHAWNVLSLVIGLATLVSMWMFSIIILGFETVFKLSVTFTVCFMAILYLLFKFTRFGRVLRNFYHLCFTNTNSPAR